MTSPDMNDEAIKMARRIADEMEPRSNKRDVREAVLNAAAYCVALAAIIETQELIAQFVGAHSRHADPADIAAAIRSGQQFRKDV